MRPSLVIFDMDGLIFNTERQFMRIIIGVQKKYGYEGSEEKYVKTQGTAGDTLAKVLHGIFGEDYPWKMISDEARAIQAKENEGKGPEIKPGIIELLEFLNKKKIPCCIASSSERKFVKSHIEVTGLEKYFQFVIGGDEIKRSKPEPDIFLHACQVAGVEPSKALVLEDSPNGIRAAAAGGIPVICIPDIPPITDEIRALTFALETSADQVINYID